MTQQVSKNDPLAQLSASHNLNTSCSYCPPRLTFSSSSELDGECLDQGSHVHGGTKLSTRESMLI